jgi:hypothetical protein
MSSRELGMGEPGCVRTPPKETIDAFVNTTEGAILYRHWGSGLRAERRIAVILYRLEEIKGAVPDHQVRAIDEAIASLTVRQLVAVCIALGG